MRNFTMKSISMLAIGGAAMLTTGCGGHGPNSYLMPKDAVVEKLTGASKTFSYGGPAQHTIQSVSKNGDTLKVRINISGGTSIPVCEARVEAIDEEWTRVTPVCPKTDSAIEDTVNEIFEKHVDEFVIAVLHDRKFDSAMMKKRMAAVAIDNMGEIRSEAKSNARQFEQLSNSSDSGWREDGSSW